MIWKKMAVIAIPIIVLTLGVPGAAAANLVMNGGFESYTAGTSGTPPNGDLI